MIKDWIESYQPKNQEDYIQALREVVQQVALAGLHRGGFFNKAAFYGGTALRIFYGLPRFSEDLDFSLLRNDESFSLDGYLKSIEEEFNALGLKVSIRIKEKSIESNIESAFLKSETLWSELFLETALPQIGLQTPLNIKIKIEVDIQPPLGFGTEEKLLLRPYSFYVKCFKIEDLFAGKMHALLFRKWKNNVKGRDWYDLEWYIQKGVRLNLKHFVLRAKDSGDWDKENMSEEEFKELLQRRIEKVDIDKAKADVSRFISNPKTLDIWSEKYFIDLVKSLKINS